MGQFLLGKWKHSLFRNPMSGMGEGVLSYNGLNRCSMCGPKGRVLHSYTMHELLDENTSIGKFLCQK